MFSTDIYQYSSTTWTNYGISALYGCIDEQGTSTQQYYGHLINGPYYTQYCAAGYQGITFSQYRLQTKKEGWFDYSAIVSLKNLSRKY